MNCQPCKTQDHAHCIDIYWGPELETGERPPMVLDLGNGATEADDYFIVPGRLYRSCFCQHKVLTVRMRDKLVEPATGPVGE